MYPQGAYAGPLAYPCVTSIDDDTGVIISGLYFNGTIWVTIASVLSYNFTSGNWKNLASAPFLQRDFNCIRVKLASSKNVLLVTGNIQVNLLQIINDALFRVGELDKSVY